MDIERTVTIELLKNGKMPERQSRQATGYDLFAAIDHEEMIYPRNIYVISAGFKMMVPPSIDATIRSRSGLASQGIIVANAPGTIDADYRGEVKVILTNVSDKVFKLRPGDRIAQLVFTHCLWPQLGRGIVHEDTERGSGGMGSTGI